MKKGGGSPEEGVSIFSRGISSQFCERHMGLPWSKGSSPPHIELSRENAPFIAALVVALETSYLPSIYAPSEVHCQGLDMTNMIHVARNLGTPCQCEHCNSPENRKKLAALVSLSGEHAMRGDSIDLRMEHESLLF